MRIDHKNRDFLRDAILGGVFTLAACGASADVTVSETSTYDFGIIKGHGSRTELIAADKARTDSELHCEGFMSMVCGNNKSGEIVRLDKDLVWELEPDKKSYLEKPFPTPEQIAEAKQRLAAMLERMKSCPQTASRPSAPDTDKCDMSPPKFDVNKSGDVATLAGHQAQRSTVSMTQTCTDKKTGDVCDLIYSFDTWLTQDDIAGSADVRAFRSAYNKKRGLDEVSGAVRGQLQQYLAPYADALRQVGGKSADLKGYPLKTVFRVSMGGEHCSAVAKMRDQKAAPGGGNVVGDAGDAASQAAASSTESAASSSATQAASKAAGGSLGGVIAGSAAGAFGSKLVGGLFAKKTPPASAPAAAASTTAAPAAPGTTYTLMEFSSETTAISVNAIPDSQFDIPAGWKKITPKPEKERELPNCPAESK